MPMFRKKPVVIEAMMWPKLWVGADAAAEILAWGDGSIELAKSGVHAAIHTAKGVMIASPGDWIIRGGKGEFYPCKPDIFNATYEPVPEP